MININANIPALSLSSKWSILHRFPHQNSASVRHPCLSYKLHKFRYYVFRFQFNHSCSKQKSVPVKARGIKPIKKISGLTVSNVLLTGTAMGGSLVYTVNHKYKQNVVQNAAASLRQSLEAYSCSQRTTLLYWNISQLFVKKLNEVINIYSLR